MSSAQVLWTTSCQEIQEGRGQRVVLLANGAPLSYREVIVLWRDSRAFCSFFSGLLRDMPYTAYFWETPPLVESNACEPFCFVVIDSPQLARVHPDANTFAQHFQSAEPQTDVVSFANLRGDARLVVPRPVTSAQQYPHLAAFVRSAPEEQQCSFWREVARCLEGRINDKRVWLSTAGLGVYWLHMRLDSRPKYYRYGPFKSLG